MTELPTLVARMAMDAAGGTLVFLLVCGALWAVSQFVFLVVRAVMDR